MQPTNALALRVMLATGLRIDDVLSRKTEELVGDKLFFVAKKTNKSGSVKLPKAIAERLRKNSNSTWLFPSPYKGGVKHLTRQAVFKDMQNATKHLDELPHVSPHSTRKTFAVELRKNEGIEAVQVALQHSDIGTTMLYALSDLGSDREQSDRLDTEALAGLVAERVARLLLPEIRMLIDNQHLP